MCRHNDNDNDNKGRYVKDRLVVASRWLEIQK